MTEMVCPMCQEPMLVMEAEGLNSLLCCPDERCSMLSIIAMLDSGDRTGLAMGHATVSSVLMHATATFLYFEKQPEELVVEARSIAHIIDVYVKTLQRIILGG